MRSPKLISAGTASINMTPMIDVVFLLIIFFLVSSHLAKQENSLALNLPIAKSGLDDSQTRQAVIINVMSDGSWQMAGAKVDQQSLAQSLRTRQMSAEEPLQLKIRTDQDVTYDKLEPILRLAAQAGIGDIVFSVYEERRR
jgi:biopolymer transport protein ExbD